MTKRKPKVRAGAEVADDLYEGPHGAHVRRVLFAGVDANRKRDPRLTRQEGDADIARSMVHSVVRQVVHAAMQRVDVLLQQRARFSCARRHSWCLMKCAFRACFRYLIY